MKSPMWKKVGQFIFSTASLVTGILVAVLIQAVISSVYDNFSKVTSQPEQVSLSNQADNGA